MFTDLVTVFTGLGFTGLWVVEGPNSPPPPRRVCHRRPAKPNGASVVVLGRGVVTGLLETVTGALVVLISVVLSVVEEGTVLVIMSLLVVLVTTGFHETCVGVELLGDGL